MSHKATVQTKITDLGILKQAITDLGLSYYEGQDLSGQWTRNWSNGDRKADLVIEIEGRKDIGFRKNAEGFYDLVGDFWGLKRGQKSLSDEIMQRYNVNYTVDAINNSSSHGITSHTITTLENGDIELEADVDETQIVVA